MGHSGLPQKKTALTFRFVRKRDGRMVAFNPAMIAGAIYRATVAISSPDEALAEELSRQVEERLLTRSSKTGTFDVEQIQDAVEKTLIDNAQSRIAKAYILYRQKRAEIRREKQQILNKIHIDEVDKNFDLPALRLLAADYLKKDAEERPTESPKKLFLRVATAAALPLLFLHPKIHGRRKLVQEKTIGLSLEEFNPVKSEGVFRIGHFVLNRWHLTALKTIFRRLSEKNQVRVSWAEFLKLLRDQKFNQYEKDIQEFYDLLVSRRFLPHPQMLINFGNVLGAGCGNFFLQLEDSVAGIMEGVRAAAMIFFQAGGEIVYNFSQIRPTGDFVRSNEGQSAGPLKFIRFFELLEGGENIFLLDVNHPDIEEFLRSGRRRFVRLLPDFWQYYERGEPYPLSNPRNQRVVKKIAGGDILDQATAIIFGREPQPIYSWGAINVSAFARDGAVSWEKMEETIKVASRFLRGALQINRYPLPEIEEAALKQKKIGLGIMGLSDLYYEQNFPYYSRPALKILDKIISLIKKEAELVILPSEKLAVLSGSSPGIEPAASLVSRRDGPDYSFYYINPVFASRMEKDGLLDEELIRGVAAAGGSLHNIGYLPEEIKKVFVTSSDVPPEHYLKIVAKIEKQSSFPILNTKIVLPEGTSPEKARKLKLTAYRLGCSAIILEEGAGHSPQRSGSSSASLISLCDVKARGPAVYSEAGIRGGASENNLKLCPHCNSAMILKPQSRSCSRCDWQVWV